MDKKEIVLITGCSPGGIGFELAALLLVKSRYVLLGCRSSEKGEAAIAELQTRGLTESFEVLDIDVDNPDSISAAALAVEAKHGRIDALVNNAAFGSLGITADEWTKSFRTNATGAYLMVEAFAQLLKKSIGVPRIVNISSGAGSIPWITEPKSPTYHLHHKMGMAGVAYGASKAALNLLTAKQAIVYGADGFKVFAYSPSGFIVSNLGPYNKAQYGAKPTFEGAQPIVRIVIGERDAEHGCFLAEKGQYQW